MPTDRTLLRGSPSFRDSCSAWMRRQFPRCSTFRARATKSLGSTCAALGGDPPDLKRHHPTGNISRRAGQLGQHPHWPILRCVRSPPDSIEQDLLEISLCRQFCRKAHGGDCRMRAGQPADRAPWRSTLPFGRRSSLFQSRSQSGPAGHAVKCSPFEQPGRRRSGPAAIDRVSCPKLPRCPVAAPHGPNPASKASASQHPTVRSKRSRSAAMIAPVTMPQRKAAELVWPGR